MYRHYNKQSCQQFQIFSCSSSVLISEPASTLSGQRVRASKFWQLKGIFIPTYKAAPNCKVTKACQSNCKLALFKQHSLYNQFEFDNISPLKPELQDQKWQLYHCANVHWQERGQLFLHFLDYLFSLVFTTIQQILGGRSHRFQSNQPKTRENTQPLDCLFLTWN